MKKRPLNKTLKGERKADNAIMTKSARVKTTAKESKDERIKKQFAQDALIHQRVKCPVAAMVCCLLHQV